MGLPTLEKTWQYNVNQVTTTTGISLTDNQNLMFLLKTTLLGFGSNPWTVISSSDSVTTGASDLWVSASNLIWSSNQSNPRSWIVLQQTGVTGGPLQILIDLAGNGSAFSWLLNCYMSASAGFTGGAINSRPTATDEAQLAAANTGSWSPSSPQNSVLHIMMSTTGANTRIVVMSAGTIRSLWFFEDLSDSSLAHKSACSVFTTFGTPPTINDYYTNPRFNGKFGSVLYTAYVGTEAYNSTNVPSANAGAISNISNAYPITPLSLHSETPSAKGRVGRLADLWFGSTSIVTGSAYPVSPNDKEFVQFNPFIVPWNGTLPVLT